MTPADPARRVLVIDDEHDMLDILRDLLEGEQFAVEVADSGEKAIELFRRSPFDVAVTDLRMAGIDGLDTLRALRELDPKLPVIVVTGYTSPDTERRCREAGAFECLHKPVDLDDLLRAVSEAARAR